MKRITILGSTGSIGGNALDIIARHRDRFKVVALAAGSNIDLIEKQIKAFGPEIVAIADEKYAAELRKRLNGRLEVLGGDQGINTVAAYGESDFVLSAMVGFSGLIPTMQAVKAGKMVGIANKETLVAAGNIVMREAEKHGSKILPVDSEHSAIFQCLEGQDRRYLRRIILTASGGPFIGKKTDELKDVSLEDAMLHPSWKMGKKVTIDSATLMNKGLEVIEASRLFGLTHEHIEVLIHPQSIIHSMVEFNDGGILSQMSLPDMRGPIGYALSYPERLDDTVARLDLADLEKLTFYRPDTETFPCLKYAYEALKAGGTMPAALNAANEVAVNAFIERRISFNAIPVIINRTMQAHESMEDSELAVVIEADRWAREKAAGYINRLN